MLSSFSTHKKVMSCFNWITSKVKSIKPMMLLKMQSNKTIKSGECMWHMSPIQSWNNFTISSCFLKIFSIERKSISHIFIYFDSIRFKCNYIIDYLWRTYIQQNRLAIVHIWLQIHMITNIRLSTYCYRKYYNQVVY